MIINHMSGGGGASTGISTRTVGLGEIYFQNAASQYTTYGYRAFTSSKNIYGNIFSFPGKVLAVTSFKYKYKTSASGTLGSEQTFTGTWFISGNQASPNMQFVANRYYVPTELTALIVDSIAGGTSETVTFTAATDSHNDRALKQTSGNNIIGFSGIPENLAYNFGDIKITGKLLEFRNHSVMSSDVPITVKLGTNTYQGITYKDDIVRITTRTRSFTFFAGFDPTFVVISKLGENGDTADEIVAASYVKSGFPTDADYNSVMYNDSNGSDKFGSVSVTYTDNWGSVAVSATSSSYYFDTGYYHVIAMK